MTRTGNARANWVPVAEEPDHRELFANSLVRVYEARIAPGATTLDHRHDRDTVYIVVRGGRLRSDNTFRQRSGTRTGRSTGLIRTIRWLIGRLTTGWLDMPDGTLLWQPHASLPLVHRVSAAPTNTAPIRMLGIELGSERASRDSLNTSGLQLEWASPRGTSYRISAEPGDPAIPLPGQAVLTLVNGGAVMSNGNTIYGSQATWVDMPEEITPTAGTPFLAILTLV